MYVLRPEKFIPYKRIEREVEHILRKAEIKLDVQFTKPPIPIEKIAEFVFELDIEWVEDFPEKNGEKILGQIDPNQRKIQLNESILLHQQSRRNFTIGHELGHFHLHYQKVTSDVATKKHLLFDDASDNKYKQKKRLERQAEYFSSSILAPYKMLINYAQKQKLERRTIRNLARRFQISIEAMEIRLEQLEDMKYLYIDKKGFIHRTLQEASGQLLLL